MTEPTELRTRVEKRLTDIDTPHADYLTDVVWGVVGPELDRLREELAAAERRREEQHATHLEVNEGWVAYKGRKVKERREFLDQIAELTGERDEARAELATASEMLRAAARRTVATRARYDELAVGYKAQLESLEAFEAAAGSFPQETTYEEMAARVAADRAERDRLRSALAGAVAMPKDLRGEVHDLLTSRFGAGYSPSVDEVLDMTIGALVTAQVKSPAPSEPNSEPFTVDTLYRAVAAYEPSSALPAEDTQPEPAEVGSPGWVAAMQAVADLAADRMERADDHGQEAASDAYAWMRNSALCGVSDPERAAREVFQPRAASGVSGDTPTEPEPTPEPQAGDRVKMRWLDTGDGFETVLTKSGAETVRDLMARTSGNVQVEMVERRAAPEPTAEAEPEPVDHELIVTSRRPAGSNRAGTHAACTCGAQLGIVSNELASSKHGKAAARRAHKQHVDQAGSAVSEGA